MNKKTIYWVVGIVVLLFIVVQFIAGGFNWGMIYDNRDPQQMIN